MSIVKSIREFVCTCPFLKDGKLNVDYLGSEATEYTVDVEPSSTIVQTYIDGGTLRQLNFIFASRESYGGVVLENIENAGFYEKFADWIERQNKNKTLPALGEGKEAQTVEALTCGYIADGDANTARYQIQCRLMYYQKG